MGKYCEKDAISPPSPLLPCKRTAQQRPCMLQAVSLSPLLRQRAPESRTHFLSLLRRVGGSTARSLALFKSYGRILIKRHSGQAALNAQVLQLREVRVVLDAAQFSRF